MGNQQSLGPIVAERVFGAVFPSYGAVAQWERRCFASIRLRVQVPPVPLFVIFATSVMSGGEKESYRIATVQ